MMLLRILLAAALLVLFTVSGLPTIGPVLVGAGCGLTWLAQGPRIAAIASVLAWGGLLLSPLVRGQPIGAVAGKVGAIMGVPGIVLVVVTVLYPVVLASAAAHLAAQASPMRKMARQGN